MPLNFSTVSEYQRGILNAMPQPLMVIEEGCRIVDTNAAANEMIGSGSKQLKYHRPGELLHCIHAGENACGGGDACQACPIQVSTQRALDGQYPPKQVLRLVVAGETGMLEKKYMMSVAPLAFENLRLALIILEDLHKTTHPQQTLRICSGCKEVHNDEDLWQSVESYLSSHQGLHCSHSLCPRCAQKLFPEYADVLNLEAESSVL